MKKYLIYCILPITLCILLFGCKEDLLVPENIHDSVKAPAITSFTPETGEPGTLIYLKGNNLSSVQYALIGTDTTEIVYRYTNTDIVLRTTGNEATGKITLVNPQGTCESANAFTVIDILPTVASIVPTPIKWMAYDEYTINGTNLNGVYEVSFRWQSAGLPSKAVKEKLVDITDKNNEKIVFTIPYFTATGNVELVLKYKQAGQPLEINGTSSPLVVDNPVINPVVDEFASQVFPGTTLTLSGEYLDRVDNITFMGEDMVITSQKSNEIKIQIPEIPDGTEYLEGEMVMYHNGTQSTILKEVLTVSMGTVYNYVYHPSITLSVRCDENLTDGAESVPYSNPNNFFNVTTGEIYSACDYASIKEKIDIFFSISSGNIQLNNPNNSDQQFKNFKCNKVGLPVEKGVKTTKFYILKDTIPAESELKQKLLNKETLSEITLAMLDTALGFSALCLVPSSSSPRWRENEDVPAHNVPANWKVGDILVFRNTENDKYPAKVGFIEIVAVDYGGKNASGVIPSMYTSTVTINVWCQKKVEASE
ncbi:hypothetical protein FACS1894153_1470 [Bacteroidia bacterium]|nr:hypothetical protein FACS1894153_1470 [Bacteroidia bacterium]